MMIKKYMRIWWVIVLLTGWLGSSWAEMPQASSASAASTAADVTAMESVTATEAGVETSFPLKVGDRTMVTFRVGILGFSAKDRYPPMSD